MRRSGDGDGVVADVRQQRGLRRVVARRRLEHSARLEALEVGRLLRDRALRLVVLDLLLLDLIGEAAHTQLEVGDRRHLVERCGSGVHSMCEFVVCFPQIRL